MKVVLSLTVSGPAWCRMLVAAVLALSILISGPAFAATKKASTKKSTTTKKTTTKKPAEADAPKADADEDEDEEGEDEKPAKKTTKSSTKSKPKPKVARAEAATTHTTQTIPTALEAAIRPYERARWGVEVKLLETGDILFKKNAEQGFIPASNRKIFTGALALDQLGPDFRFQTYLYRTGPVSGGTLNGNLIIKPQGDPTFNNRMFRGQPPDWIYRKWVDQVKGQGITTVQGSLIVDCSEWDMNDLTPQGWAANVRQDHYAPQTSPLTINENLFEIKVRPGAAAGQKAIIEFNPPAEGYPVINNTTTGEGGGLSVRKNDRGLIEINGSIGLKAGVKSYGMPCDRPALYAACVLRSHLHRAGVRITGDLRLATDRRGLPPPTTENTIAMYPSPPMSDMVKTMMKHSNNHFAEQLYVAVSAMKKGKGGYRNSMALENELLTRAGVNPAEIQIFDGCGLSRMNKVEPHQVTSLLDYMMRHQHAQAFFDSMAISGKDGTLRGRLQGNGTREKVYAKTGFINGVSCLSGYLLLQPQKTIIFSFLVNDVPGSTGGIKSTQDRLLTLLSMLTI